MSKLGNIIATHRLRLETAGGPHIACWGCDWEGPPTGTGMVVITAHAEHVAAIAESEGYAIVELPELKAESDVA